VSSVEQEFIEDLAAYGIHVTSTIVADGRLHRAHVHGDRGNAKNLVYKIHDDDWPSWYFCDHKRGIEATGSSKVAKSRNLSPAEMDELRRKAAAAKKAREEELRQHHARRSAYCAQLYETAKPANDNHPYLAAKGMPATRLLRQVDQLQAAEFFEGAEPRLIRDVLLVPVYGADGLQSVQAIQPDGTKLYCAGAPIVGGYHPIRGDTAVTVICEGYATGAAIHHATGYSVACAMSAGNLEAVADALKQKYPAGRFAICADNDHATKGNPGISAGRKVAVKYDWPVLAPDFGQSPEPGETDWDDWLRGHGSAEQLKAIIDAAFAPPEPDALPAIPELVNPAQVYSWAEVDLTIPAKYSELSVSKQFAASYAPVLRWVEDWKGWMVWAGHRWSRDNRLASMEHAKRLCAAVADYARNDFAAFSNENQIRATIEKYGSARAIGNVLNLAKSDPIIAADVDQWDADPWRLNTPGGTVDLRTGQMHPHRREDYMTKSTAATPEGDCPTWLAFLDTATGGDTELQAFIQRMVGYCLTGSVRDHALFFVYGSGGNGKGTFLNTIEAILAGYATTSPMDTFTESKDKAHPTELARLVGARLVTAQETEEGKRWAEDRIKALTGGDRISARFMNKDFFEYNPQFKLVFAGNHRPSLRNVDEAIRRRLHLIPFTVVPPRKDPELPAKLRAEAGGILAWAVQGCLEWQRIGLQPPEIVKSATDAYLEEQDVFGSWIDSCCVTGKTYEARSSTLYASFKRHCENAGEFVVSQKRWGAIMGNRGFMSRKTNGLVVYQGIQVRADDEFGPGRWSADF